MHAYVPAEPTEALEAEARAEALREVEPLVEEMMVEHRSKRRLWFPSDFLPADEAEDEDAIRVLERLRERARSISDAIRVSVVLGLLTEEGLPHFHRLLSNYLGEGSSWSKWNRMWTAEEDRHGMILHDYARDARLFRMKEVEMMQFAYQEAGFEPAWDKDPYRVFVYTTLQERATQITHRNTGRTVGDEEPVLKGIFQNIAADEAKHFSFYRRVFKALLEIDPNRALQSALAVMPAIDMPGITMPDFKEMADVVRRTGIYGPWDYKKIVEEAIEFWQIEVIEGLNDAGRMAQEKILAIPKRLQRVAEYIESRSQSKSFSFGFIYDRVFSMG
ncbi:MAG TPA: acyl-ACP desaturase [Rhodothermales bacterium]|nr:acyl-ACP desaturase [Rhodothermales bacterium]